jgi:hypothetical protein
MSKKYKTKIEITSPAADRNEAMEIVEDYLSGNIVSGIDMKCSTKQVRFYDHAAAKALAVVLLAGMGLLLSVHSSAPRAGYGTPVCQMAAVQPPLRTAGINPCEAKFKKEWEEKQTREALDFIKK